MSVTKEELMAAGEGFGDAMEGKESASILVLMFQGYAISAAYDGGYEAGLEEVAAEREGASDV